MRRRRLRRRLSRVSQSSRNTRSGMIILDASNYHSFSLQLFPSPAAKTGGNRTIDMFQSRKKRDWRPKMLIIRFNSTNSFSREVIKTDRRAYFPMDPKGIYFLNKRNSQKCHASISLKHHNGYLVPLIDKSRSVSVQINNVKRKISNHGT